MLWPKGKQLIYSSTNFPNLLIFFLIFSITLCTQLGLPHPSIVGICRCVCTHPINPMGIHLLQCVHSNERTKTHNVIHDTFAIIVQDVYFHLG
jgi:hypothetical protein